MTERARTRARIRQRLPAGFPSALRRVFEAHVGTRAADEARWALERPLARLLAAGGLRGVERALAATQRVALTGRTATARTWRAPHPGGDHAVVIAVSSDRFGYTVSVTYEETAEARERRMTPRQRARHARQQAFYARYLAAGRVAYASAGGWRRLSRPDRLVLRIGEFEADVNNGGFSQYLANKGRRRARRTLRDLQSIGAARSARLLAQALAATEDAVLSKLDERFDQVPEDLPVLALRQLDARANRRG